MSKNNEEFYKNEGIAVFVKGRMIMGIHPENLENVAKALNNEDVKIDFEVALKYPGLGVIYKDSYIEYIQNKIENRDKMKYFESNHPYYALIAAEDKGEAVQLYIANVAGDSEESADIEEELKEVSRDYALTKIKRSPGENGESLTGEEAIKELNQSNRVILTDGSLL